MEERGWGRELKKTFQEKESWYCRNIFSIWHYINSLAFQSLVLPQLGPINLSVLTIKNFDGSTRAETNYSNLVIICMTGKREVMKMWTPEAKTLYFLLAIYTHNTQALKKLKQGFQDSSKLDWDRGSRSQSKFNFWTYRGEDFFLPLPKFLFSFYLRTHIIMI